MDGQTLQAKLRQATQAKIKIYPCNNVRASEIGHPCERYIVLSITNWEDKRPHDAALQNIFDLGNAIEAEVIRRLKEAGFELLTASRNFKINKPLISGREDIMIKDTDTGELLPCEIKGLSPVAFDKIDTLNDMLNHRAYYIRKYPAQLQIYLLNFNKERGFFILFNKINGAIKVIEVSLDYEYAELLLQKAERVYKHISGGTLPDCIDDETICRNCPLLHICGAKINTGDTAIDTGELQMLLEQRERLIPYVREYERNKQLIKYYMKNCDRAFTSTFAVEKRVIRKRPFVVAGSVYTKEIIRKIGGKTV